MRIGRETRPSLGIVIVNWNGRDHLLACLDSIAIGELQPRAIIVVDNNSTDGSLEAVEGAFPEIVIFRNESNLGFARANNIGGTAAVNLGCDLVLFLNNDTLVAPDALCLMVAAAQKSRVAIVNPQITNENGDIWFAGATFRRRSGEVRHSVKRVDPNRGPLDIDSATGCALLTRADIVTEFGPFDERYFIYYEDSDLSAKLRRRGERIVLEPAAFIRHKVGADSLKHESSGFFYYLNTRNRLLFMRRNLPTLLWVWCLVGFTVIYVVPRAVALFMLGRATKAKALLRGYADYFRKRFGPPRLEGWKS